MFKAKAQWIHFNNRWNLKSRISSQNEFCEIFENIYIDLPNTNKLTNMGVEKKKLPNNFNFTNIFHQKSSWKIFFILLLHSFLYTASLLVHLYKIPFANSIYSSFRTWYQNTSMIWEKNFHFLLLLAIKREKWAKNNKISSAKKKKSSPIWKEKSIEM